MQHQLWPVLGLVRDEMREVRGDDDVTGIADDMERAARAELLYVPLLGVQVAQNVDFALVDIPLQVVPEPLGIVHALPLKTGGASQLLEHEANPARARLVVAKKDQPRAP